MTDKKQSGRDWLIEQFVKWNFGDSDESFGTQEIHHGIDLVEQETAERILEWIGNQTEQMNANDFDKRFRERWIHD
jgi:hypothetical protein